CAQRAGCTLTGAQPGGLRNARGVYRLGHGAADSATDAVRTPVHAAGSASEQALLAGSPNAPAAEFRYLQPPERQVHADDQQHVRPALPPPAVAGRWPLDPGRWPTSLLTRQRIEILIPP